MKYNIKMIVNIEMRIERKNGKNVFLFITV